MAAFTVFFAWVKVFDWLRLFDETAFYMKLLKQTLEDMWSFVLIYAVGLAMVGSSMYVMQMSVVGAQENSYIVENVTSHFFLDSLYNQYMLSLGEFTMDGFEDHPAVYFCLGFFLFATFFSQIIVLNMLIAIMGNTFSMVIERKAQYAMQTKLQVMSDHAFIRRFIAETRKQDDNKYLFIVKTTDI